MLRQFTILILLLCQSALAAPGDSRLPTKVASELKKVPAYQEGAQAMSDQLHDIAVLKFRTALTNPKVSTTARPYVTLSLAEALIRSSSSPQGGSKQATEALELLAEESVQKLNSTPIWKAEAMASLRRYLDADQALAELPTSHPLYSDSQLARARILLALNRVPDALRILVKASESKSTPIRNAANLLAAEIHITQNRFKTAQGRLDAVDETIATDAKLKEYLNARLTLAEGNSADAINRFQSIITAPNNLSKRIVHASILGKADAQVANKQVEDAITTLEQFISDYPDALALQDAFVRLSKILPKDLEDDHPSMVKLRQWSGESPLPGDSLYIGGDSIMAIRPQQSATGSNHDLVSLALYHRAILLARTEDENKHALAMALLARLRAQHANNPLPPSELYLELSSASLIDTAYLHLKQNQTDMATFTLSVMEKVAFSPHLKNRANQLRGLLLANDNKPAEALEAFSKAMESNSTDIAHAASVNAGIMALEASNLTAFENIVSSTQITAVSTALKLERALWKCSENDISGRGELESFIMNYPGHPRENEARMALASACVNISPPDVILAKAQLEMIAERLSDAASQLVITRIRIRAEELDVNEEKWTAAAAAAEAFIRRFPDDPNVPSILLKQAEAYYHNEDYNKARRVFQDIPAKYPESPFAPYANFYAAMAARLGGTSQAREECIPMFQTVIDSKHALASEARIQQSRVLIDLRRYTEAEKSLSPLLKSKTATAPRKRAAGVLMADCLHRQGSVDATKYEQAISIYNELLATGDLPLAWRNRLHFLRGQTYESMSLTSAAFSSYYDVIIRGNMPAEGEATKEEWLWFYRCGFKALSMLENEKRWEAAVKLAQRIASFSGPRAEEASKRAHSLAVKHMIWSNDRAATSNPETPE